MFGVNKVVVIWYKLLYLCPHLTVFVTDVLPEVIALGSMIKRNGHKHKYHGA